MIAFLFPGQGTQFPGMYRLLHSYREEVDDIFQLASEISKKSIKDLCLTGTSPDLLRTVNTQMAVTCMNLSFWRILSNRGLHPDVVLGHSLGQFAAAIASASLSLEDGMLLVQKRAQLMEEVEAQGELKAITGLTLERIQEICDENDQISIALHNTPTQVVVGGPVRAMDATDTIFRQAGAISISKVNASNAFHTLVMEEMVPEFASFIETLRFSDPLYPLILNCSGQLTKEPKNIKHDMILQCCNTVRWVDSLNALVESVNGSDLVTVEVGVGKTLAGLMRSFDRTRKVFISSEPRQMSQLLSLIAI